MATVDQLIQAELSRIVDIRHDLHAHPELGYQEERTSRIVRDELGRLGLEHVGGLAGGTGVLGYLASTNSKPEEAPTIALRADMDALPITENTGQPYASKNTGVMHACGHDGHTSILLGAAAVLKQSERPNNVLLVFQPAEEGGGGGRKMCEDGVLDGSILGRAAERIYGLHGFPFLQVGEIATRTGALLASADGFEIHIKGKGGHAALPHVGIDPIVVASHIVVALQSIASRNISPLDSIVVTIGKVEAGTANNVIPDTATLIGTLRALTAHTREVGEERIRRIANDVAQAFGASATVEWLYGYPVTWNDPDATQDLRKVLEPVFGHNLIANDVEPVMGAEDFSFYGERIPACFYWLGLLNPGQQTYPNLHAPEFDFNDASIPVGIKAMCSLALSSKWASERQKPLESLRA